MDVRFESNDPVELKRELKREHERGIMEIPWAELRNGTGGG